MAAHGHKKWYDHGCTSRTASYSPVLESSVKGFTRCQWSNFCFRFLLNSLSQSLNSSMYGQQGTSISFVCETSDRIHLPCNSSLSDSPQQVEEWLDSRVGTDTGLLIVSAASLLSSPSFLPGYCCGGNVGCWCCSILSKC